MKRAIAVAAALSGFGVLCGAILGSIAIWVTDAVLPGTTTPGDRLTVIAWGVFGGALFGAILAPSVAWLFLRRVPLGRAILGTAAGVLAGVGIGAIIRPQFTIFSGLAGFVAAAVVLRLTIRERPKESSVTP